MASKGSNIPTAPNHNSPPPPYEEQLPPPLEPRETQLPAYETAVGHVDDSSASGPQTQGTDNPPTLTISGKYIVASHLPPDQPLYSLSHALDGHELGHGILVTRLEKKSQNSNSLAMRYHIPGGEFARRDVFSLQDAMQFPLGPGGYAIDGRRFLSGKQGTMSRCMTRYGPGWSVSGKKLPAFEIRPGFPLGKRRGSGNATGEGDERESIDGERLYEWRVRMDKKSKDETLIAIERRRRWDKEKQEEITPPTLEMKVDLGTLDQEFLDFFVSAWCLHNWREAKEVTREPLTWEEFKQQAKVTKKKMGQREGGIWLGGIF
ncbi:hypothetical protein FQN52_006309 [Onygenales sp. PD_12]|nr:hypothetical protein FQN52_006309 [Onygenales sp. PD_12]